MYLFDSSAIINILKRGRADLFIDGYTIDLAYYESLNALWKEYKLLHRIDESKLSVMVELVTQVIDVLPKINVKDLSDAKHIVDLAVRESMTIYDASYLYVALKYKLTLITDDKKLRRIAGKLMIKSMSSTEFIREGSGS